MFSFIFDYSRKYTSIIFFRKRKSATITKSHAPFSIVLLMVLLGALLALADCAGSTHPQDVLGDPPLPPVFLL
jgi:hypothetical protein